MNGEECIRFWALAEHASHKSIRRLLTILNAKTDLTLPKDPRTLLGTLRNRATMSNIGEGSFWYHGISHVLTKELQKYTNVPDHLHYDINVDGLPLHKRSRKQFWPILLKIVGEPFLPVLIVGIYCGESKPESNEPFLRPLVEEINSLQTTGLQLNDATVNVTLRAIIADTPARAFLKGVQGHTGKHSCLKCCCEGVSVAQRIVFLNTNAPKRSDQAFRNREYTLHQTGFTPLLDINNFDIIENIIVVDRLHQIDIGVTKRLLYIWYMGMLRGRKRWNREQRRIIQQRLNRQTLPDETDRKLRSLDELQFWKGSENKTFLHYAAPVVLRGILTDEEYKHFMLYFCAVTIFSSAAHKELWSAARDMLKRFVDTFAQVYDETGVTSNVHNLVHLYEEAVRFGPLDNFSTYAFERKLGYIKSGLIRSNYRCQEQAIRRILEIENSNFPQKPSHFTKPFYRKRGDTVSFYLRPGFRLRNDNVNNWFLSQNYAVLKFVTVNSNYGILKVVAKSFSCVYEYFENHISSLSLLIFSAEISDLVMDDVEVECADIKCKLVLTYQEDMSMVFFPLLSTLS